MSGTLLAGGFFLLFTVLRCLQAKFDQLAEGFVSRTDAAREAPVVHLLGGASAPWFAERSAAPGAVRIRGTENFQDDGRGGGIRTHDLPLIGRYGV